MRPALIALTALLVLGTVAALALGLSRRSQTAGSGEDEGFPTLWSAGAFTYRTDLETGGCEMKITTEVIEPEGFDGESRVLSVALSALDPARIETTSRNPALGLPGLLTFHARPGETVACTLLEGGPCPTATRDKAELQLPPFWADRPDDLARLIRADIDGCTPQ
ncbi:hypothetical protein [Oceanicola sp. 502str15]|uniref:hypothetical protein n=1 Tax=Oceanicola sp. 502str15 TaxID=2696061 RepID=UPI00209634C5|nr:hypothetical protein [Oceanicola sp. 502str15]MCO6382186.1 hypothetical protein [Oceanicola sp. 502str15]